MMELRNIVALWREQQGAGSGAGKAVLVTLVGVEGSSYRLPGARLLLASDGRVAGTISGGCLESDVVKRALWLTREGAVVERYTMSFDDTAEIPFGLGCGGTIDLLFEPLETPEGTALMSALQSSLAGEELDIVTYLPGDGRTLRRVVMRRDASVAFASSALAPEKIACARALDPAKSYPGRFVERLHPPQRLLVFGAGDDARPLVALGAALGWTVMVADGRKHLARAERFPAAEQVMLLQDDQSLPLTRDDAVVLMTHSYEQDRACLLRALAVQPRYIGLLGSRHRSSLLITEAAEALGRSVESCCADVYAPVGLDLGGDGPEAIALAIASQIQAVCHGRQGKTARLDPQEIAWQIKQGGASRFQAAQCVLNAAS